MESRIDIEYKQFNYVLEDGTKTLVKVKVIKNSDYSNFIKKSKPIVPYSPRKYNYIN